MWHYCRDGTSKIFTQCAFLATKSFLCELSNHALSHSITNMTMWWVTIFMRPPDMSICLWCRPNLHSSLKMTAAFHSCPNFSFKASLETPSSLFDQSCGSFRTMPQNSSSSIDRERSFSTELQYLRHITSIFSGHLRSMLEQMRDDRGPVFVSPALQIHSCVSSRPFEHSCEGVNSFMPKPFKKN